MESLSHDNERLQEVKRRISDYLGAVVLSSSQRMRAIRQYIARSIRCL